MFCLLLSAWGPHEELVGGGVGWVCRGVGEAGGDDVSLDRRVGGGRGGGLGKLEREACFCETGASKSLGIYSFIYLFIYTGGDTSLGFCFNFVFCLVWQND